MGIKRFVKKLARAPLDAIKGIVGYTSGKDIREARSYTAQREDSAIQRKVADAKAAGVHPLFALGGATGGASTATFPQSGSQIGEAFRYIQKSSSNKARLGQSSLVDTALIKQANANAGLAEAREATVEWELQNSINKRAESEANFSQDIVIPGITQGQQIKPGEVDPFVKKNPEKSLNIKSPMTRFRIGSQNPWLPVDDMEQVMEDPVAVFIAAASYHGNKDIDFTLLYKEYTGRRTLPQYMKDNIRKYIPIRVRKKHLLKKYAKPSNFGAMP